MATKQAAISLTEDDLDKLQEHLRPVTEWFSFGVALKVPIHVLKEIEKNYPDLARRKIEVLMYWFDNNKDCTLMKLVEVLSSLGHACLAEKIKQFFIDDEIQDTVMDQATPPTYVCPSASPSQYEPQEQNTLILPSYENDQNASVAKHQKLCTVSETTQTNTPLQFQEDSQDTLPTMHSNGSDDQQFHPSSVQIDPSTQTDHATVQTNKYSVKLEDGKKIREYQHELAEPGIRGENYIFVAPTGSGKTLVSALVISSHLNKRQHSKTKPRVVFMVNNKPLAVQQEKQLNRYITCARVKRCIGDPGSADPIADSIQHNEIIVCTAGKLLDEIERGDVKLEQFSLVVMDECHHTRKRSPQAMVMEHYLDAKKNRDQKCDFPQVIGMTASPGAGDNRGLEVKKTIDHLLMLAARMDATGGLRYVKKHKQELDQVTNEINFKLEPEEQRKGDEEFIKCVISQMEKLEESVPYVKSSFPKWSQEYETRIQHWKVPIEEGISATSRDPISILRLLQCYCEALNIYMDLRHQDAMKILKDYSDLPSELSNTTPIELELKENRESLLSNLKCLPPIENSLLKKAENILKDCFESKSGSRGIFFVRTRIHTYAIRDWIQHLPIAKQLNIHPCVITGHTRDAGAGMTQVAQERVIESFRKGECNLLVATSVAEEGLDIPECNFVIRFQHITNEIAMTQAQGRARAENSKGFTILSSNSKMKVRERKNAELIALLKFVIEKDLLPTGSHFEDRLRELQDEIIMKKRIRERKKQLQMVNSGKSVSLRCKKCKTIACNGSDVYVADKTNHHLVPDRDFREKKLIHKPHHTPGAFSTGIYKTEKIYCAKCDADWGVMCFWPAEGNTFPVLKCKSFIFNTPEPVKKWSEAPFEVFPLSTWLDLNSESEQSEEDKDSSA